MKKTISIRIQIYSIIALAALLCVVTIVFSSITNQSAIQGMHVVSDLNSSLNEFYLIVEKMDANARDWLYTEDPETYKTYISLFGEAKNELNWISNGSEGKLEWRMGLLSNMLDFYNEPIERYLDGKESKYQTYDDLVYRNMLIRETSAEYYRYLSDFLESNAEAVEGRWRHKWVIQGVLIILFFVVGVAVGSVYSKNILRPIQTMARNAYGIQAGDYSFEPVGKACSELMVLAETFEEMAVRIQNNINVLKKNAELEQALLQQERERLVMQNLITQAELKTLQAQINPHFLFNTLSMISKSAYLNHDAITSELIERLAEFLRYALGKSNTTTTLVEEIQSIHNYLFIQQQRFGKRLNFVIDVPDNIPVLHMPAIILQPLVENAIKHGVNSMTEGATISLKVWTRDRQIVIQIEDNGVGMPAEILEKLQSCLQLGLDCSHNNSGTGIGLTNVYRRLQMFFGNEMQFSIDGEEDCGTLITICLPMEDQK